MTVALFNEMTTGHRAATLGTPFWRVRQWMKTETPPARQPNERWRVDLIVHDGVKESPHEQGIWAFVEVKHGFIDADPLEHRKTDYARLVALAAIMHPHPHP